MGQINNYGLVWPTQTIITHWVVFHGKREIWTVSWSHSVSSLSLATALLPFSYAVGLFWASPQFCQWASWTPGRMLKMPKILIFLAILALGASHPLISGGVIRSHKSMPKWRPFQTAGEDPRILPLAAAIMKENSAAPHPPILHGNGPVSISKKFWEISEMYDFCQGFSVSSGESGGLGSIRVWNQELTPRPNLFLAGFRQWSLHGLWKSWLAHPSQFWSKKTVHSFPTDRPPPQVNHQKWFSTFWLSDSTFSLKTLKVNLVDRRIWWCM